MVNTVETLASVCLLVFCVTTSLVPGSAAGLRDPSLTYQNRKKAISILLDAIGEEQEAIGTALDDYAIAQAAETARSMVKDMLKRYPETRKSWELRNALEQIRSAKEGKEGTITPFPTMEIISTKKFQSGGPENLPSLEMFTAQVDQLDETLAAAKLGTEILSNGTKIIMIDSAAIKAAETAKAEAVKAMDAIKNVAKLTAEAMEGVDGGGGGGGGGFDWKWFKLHNPFKWKRLQRAREGAASAVGRVDTKPSSITEFALAAASTERKLSAAAASGDTRMVDELKRRLAQMQSTLKSSSSSPSSGKGGWGFGQMMSGFKMAWGRHEKTTEHRARSAKLLAEVAQANMEAEAEVSKQVSDDRARALSLANEAAELKARLAKAEERIVAIKKRTQEMTDGIVLKRAELRKLVKQLEALRSQNEKLQESITMMSTSVESNAQLFDTA